MDSVYDSLGCDLGAASNEADSTAKVNQAAMMKNVMGMS